MRSRDRPLRAVLRASDYQHRTPLQIANIWRYARVALCGICDDWEQASHNGDLAHAVERGLVGRDEVANLGDVLTGKADGRRSADEITVFDSIGLAILDLAVALAALEHTNELDLPMFDLWPSLRPAAMARDGESASETSTST